MAWVQQVSARKLGFVVLMATACSSTSTPGPGTDAGSGTDSALGTGTGVHDASAPRDGALTRVDAGPCDPSTSATGCCDPRTVYTANPWVPPTPFQNVCSSAQIAAYNTCSDMGDCSTFRTATANAVCLACIETDVGKAQWGPVITESESGIVFAALINYGGCEAVRDGDTSAQSCGAKNNDNVNCVFNACGGCADWSTSGPTSAACVSAAAQSGGCRAYASTPACLAEQAEGGVASRCGPDLVDVLTTWCGGAGLAAGSAADAAVGDSSVEAAASSDAAFSDAASMNAASSDASADAAATDAL